MLAGSVKLLGIGIPIGRVGLHDGGLNCCGVIGLSVAHGPEIAYVQHFTVCRQRIAGGEQTGAAAERTEKNEPFHGAGSRMVKVGWQT